MQAAAGSNGGAAMYADWAYADSAADAAGPITVLPWPARLASCACSCFQAVSAAFLTAAHQQMLTLHLQLRVYLQNCAGKGTVLVSACSSTHTATARLLACIPSAVLLLSVVCRRCLICCTPR